jgi:Tfp pilus assembly PilM family ATPase
MSLLDRFFTAPRPSVAVEISARGVTALRAGAGSPPTIDAHATEPLAPGLVTPALAAPNVADPVELGAAVRRALARVGGARHVALVVPDPVAKVTLVRFDQVPARASDFESMVRWHVRKSLPFKAEEAQVTWSPGAAVEGGGGEFVVAAARRDVIAQYEAACTAAGAHAGVVDLTTFNLVNLQLAAGATTGDWLLVHLAADYATLAVVRDGALIFYRHREAGSDETLADLVHQTAMYYEDRLDGRGFGRVFMAGATGGPEGPAGADGVRRTLVERLGPRVEIVDPRAVATLTDRVGATPDLLDALAPLVGILVREPAA